MVPDKSSLPVLLENVIGLIKSKVESKDVKLVEQFVRQLYSEMRYEDLIERSDSDLYCAAISLWNRLNDGGNRRPDVRVYNPEISLNGWQSTHTIVEIIVTDRPFLVDSVTMVLNRLGIISHLMLHQVFSLKRNKSGLVSRILKNPKNLNDVSVETVFLLEIDRQTEQSAVEGLTHEITAVLEEVALAVNDWKSMQDMLTTVIERLSRYTEDNVIDYSETITFLRWVYDHNFTLLGYRHYDIKPIEGDYLIIPDTETSLGIMKNSKNNEAFPLSRLSVNARREVLGPNTLVLTKSDVKSRIHRPANIDYIGIKIFDKNQNVIAEERFIGLYVSAIYNRSVVDIPLVWQKLARIMVSSSFKPGNHSYNALLNIFETYPRDELIQASEEEILQWGLGVLNMRDRDQVKLFIRRDLFGRYYSCMVYVIKERYNTELRIKTQEILARSLGSNQYVEFNTYFSEGNMARTHYLVRVDRSQPEIEIDLNKIEQNISEAARSWDDKFRSAIVSHYGEEKGRHLSVRYTNSFQQSYKEDVLPSTAVADIIKLESLSDMHKLEMIFYRTQEEQHDSAHVRLKLFHKDEPIHLSDVLPMLENMGLRVIGETPFQVKVSEQEVYWILDFSMLYTGPTALDLSERRNDFLIAFNNIWYRKLENDGFNKLVLSTRMSGRQVSILRAYAKYMRQIGNLFSQTYIEKILAELPELANALYYLFEHKFAVITSNGKQYDDLVADIDKQLEHVTNLDDDRIIRRYIDLINATSRTNYFQKDTENVEKEYLSFKFLSEKIPGIPLPLPKFEVFVYSPEVEGVHLRGGKVARGGLRWSDRREDFRTEILGLVKAQQVKNTVIVPVGAKGGFVCKALTPNHSRDEAFNIAKLCYKIFIRGLLDLTDNIIDGELQHPGLPKHYDEDDPYLVVAADKGTATFSDIANEISHEYSFWLGDAFASGGSVGYDHKKMGITAKGAWESVKRHFREMNIDCQEQSFSCIAIGDMSGDVFGNGMLLSNQTKLIAAFNHLHIFIDPTPDVAVSYAERLRLFKLPGSNWDDYDRTIISPGGGVFLRFAKSIVLTPEIQALLGTAKKAMTPTELIQTILTCEADLLWNGGIGTYVKSSLETHNDVGDRSNDNVRVNADQLKVKIIGEGGNLGFTQLGRIEYAKNGGRINTDFIDNVGGVDCSDNEVNIKILLNAIVNNGDLTVKQRNNLLFLMKDEVSQIVLTNAYKQTLSISVTQKYDALQLKEQIRFMHYLERAEILNRALEFLPSEDELAERLARSEGLTRPELSVLLAYAKMHLKEQLNCPEVYDDPDLADDLISAFPQILQKQFPAEMKQHPLKHEIIATRLANDIVNDMGASFIGRMEDETGSTVVEIAKCYVMSKTVFGMSALWESVCQLDNKISADMQLQLLYESRRFVRRGTRWLLRHRDRNAAISDIIAFYKPTYDGMKEIINQLTVEEEQTEQDEKIKALTDNAVPKQIAQEVVYQNKLYSCFDIADVCKQHQIPLTLVVNIYFSLGSKLELHWFLNQINLQPVANHWQALARAAFREELEWQQRSLTDAVLSTCLAKGSCDIIIDNWLDEHAVLIQRWEHILADFKMSSSHEFAKFSVALRELHLLNLSCRNAN